MSTEFEVDSVTLYRVELPLFTSVVEASVSNTHTATVPLPLMLVMFKASVVPSHAVTVPFIQFVLMYFWCAVTVSPTVNPLIVEPDRTVKDFEPVPMVRLDVLVPSTLPEPAP